MLQYTYTLVVFGAAQVVVQLFLLGGGLELKLNKFTRKKADSFLGYNRSVCMVDLPKWW